MRSSEIRLDIPFGSDNQSAIIFRYHLTINYVKSIFIIGISIIVKLWRSVFSNIVLECSKSFTDKELSGFSGDKRRC